MTPTSRPSDTFATTFGYFTHPAFAHHARVLPVPPALNKLPAGPFRLSDEVLLFLRVLWAALHESRLLLFSSRGRLKPELLAIVCMALWPRRLRPRIALYGEMYEPNTGVRAIFERILMRLADRAIDRYIVYSTDESRFFPQLWGVDPGKMRVALCFIDGLPEDAGPEQPRGTHIFAGGNSFREYGPLIEAARQLPEYHFVIGTTIPQHVKDIPSNVQLGALSPEQYSIMNQTAAAVVVPLRKGVKRLIGQITYFEAMWNRTPPIVTDTVAVSEYVQDGVTGLVVDGTPEAYVKAVRWMCDPANTKAVQRMGEQAHASIRDRFTFEQHMTTMVAVMDELRDHQQVRVKLVN